MTARHYWGFLNSYGVGTMAADTGERIGILVRFDSKAERDEWVDSDPAPAKKGRRECEAVSHKEARRYMLTRCYGADVNGIVWYWGFPQEAPCHETLIDDLWVWYRALEYEC